jgi:hypothetical protein
VFACQGIVKFEIEILIEKEAEIRVFKELYLIIMLEMLKERGIKEFKELIKAVYTALAVCAVLAFLDVQVFELLSDLKESLVKYKPSSYAEN